MPKDKDPSKRSRNEISDSHQTAKEVHASRKVRPRTDEVDEPSASKSSPAIDPRSLMLGMFPGDKAMSVAAGAGTKASVGTSSTLASTLPNVIRIDGFERVLSRLLARYVYSKHTANSKAILAESRKDQTDPDPLASLYYPSEKKKVLPYTITELTCTFESRDEGKLTIRKDLLSAMPLESFSNTALKELGIETAYSSKSTFTSSYTHSELKATDKRFSASLGGGWQGMISASLGLELGRRKEKSDVSGISRGAEFESSRTVKLTLDKGQIATIVSAQYLVDTKVEYKLNFIVVGKIHYQLNRRVANNLQNKSGWEENPGDVSLYELFEFAHDDEKVLIKGSKPNILNLIVPIKNHNISKIAEYGCYPAPTIETNTGRSASRTLSHAEDQSSLVFHMRKYDKANKPINSKFRGIFYSGMLSSHSDDMVIVKRVGNQKKDKIFTTTTTTSAAFADSLNMGAGFKDIKGEEVIFPIT